MLVVDPLFSTEWADKSRWPYKQSCHLFSTIFGKEGEEELLAFGKVLGLKPEWLQRKGTSHVHFDLTASKRVQALQQGAQEVSPEEAARIDQEKRAAECRDLPL